MTFPANGPATPELVKAHLGITDNADDAAISGVVGAVNAKVQTFPVAAIADTDPAPGDWSDPAFAHIVQGAVLLAARLFRRRNSPDGVTAIDSASPAYIARTDPDVALLLQIGDNVAPAVG